MKISDNEILSLDSKSWYGDPRTSYVYDNNGTFTLDGRVYGKVKEIEKINV